MKMQMRHALSRLLADVGHDAVALNALLLGELGNDLEDVRDDGAVLFVTPLQPEICVLGITRMWVGAWGLMSRKAKTKSSS